MMIEMGKKYRTADAEWVDPVITEVTDNYSYGRVGMFPVSWHTSSGILAICPKELLHAADQLALVEVLPEVTVRRHFGLSRDGELWALHDETSVFNCTLLGQIDITHNSKEIVKVEVVK